MTRGFTPWTWLKGFGYFLILWPLLCFGFAGQDLNRAEDDGSFLVVVIGPALLGGLLLILELLLSRFFGQLVQTLPRPIPNSIRDLSNCFCSLLILGLVLVAGFLAGGGSPAELGDIFPSLLGLTILTLGLRLLSRLLYGPARLETLGKAWLERVLLARILGYMGLVPLLILIPVWLLDIAVEDFRLYEELLLLFFFWLCLRGAMASPAGLWAKLPWEYEVRRLSLQLPWLLLVLVLLWGFAGLLLSSLFVDAGSAEGGTNIVLRLLALLVGGGCSYLGYRLAKSFGSSFLSAFLAMRALLRNPQDLTHWQVRTRLINGKFGQSYPSSTVVLMLRDGRQWSRTFEESEYPLARFLRARYPDRELSAEPR